MLIVNEINLLESSVIEGLLNDAMTGQASPGFHLFATINPQSFQGRHAFSPALKSRLSQRILRDYSADDLRQIARVSFPNEAQADMMSSWHLKLNTLLKNQGTHLRAAASTLRKLGAAVHAAEKSQPGGQISKDGLQAMFRQHYSLYLSAASVGDDDLDAVILEDLTETEAQAERISQLLSKTEPLPARLMIAARLALIRLKRRCSLVLP